MKSLILDDITHPPGGWFASPYQMHVGYYPHAVHVLMRLHESGVGNERQIVYMTLHREVVRHTLQNGGGTP